MMNGVNCNVTKLGNYVLNNESDLYLVYGYGYKTLSEEKAARENSKTRKLIPKNFTEFVGIPKEWIIENFDKFSELLDKENRIRNLSIRTILEKTCGGMSLLKEKGFKIVKIDKPYSDFEKGDNNTRSTEIEKALSEQTNQCWIGESTRESAFKQYGIDVLKDCKIIPDLWNKDKEGIRRFTEIKCSRGHLTHD